MSNSLMNHDFSYETLTAGVNSSPVALGPVARSGLFTDNPCLSVDVAIELINEELSVIQSSPRGGIGSIHPKTGRHMVKLKCPHLLDRATILADSWQGVVGFNQGGTPANVLTEKDRILAEARRRIEVTIGYHKTRALSGVILDADGSVLVDLLSEFGVTQHVVDCALDTSTTRVANVITAARRLAEPELGSAYAASWVCFASPSFMDALRSNPSLEAALSGWNGATALTADIRAGDLVIAGVRFVEVPNMAGKTYIDADTAFLCPEGVPNLCVTHFAPADYIETTNQTALPLYAKAEPLDFNRGIEIETQSNPLSIVTRPRAIIRLTA